MKVEFSVKGVAFLLLGLIILGYAGYLQFKPQSRLETVNMQIIKDGIVTTGEVTSLQKNMQKEPGQENNPDSVSRLYEIVKVKYSVNGTKFETTGSRVLQQSAWEKGARVEVSYDPANPRKAVVKEHGVAGVEDNSMLVISLLIAGIIMLSLGFIFSYPSSRQK